MVKINRAVFLLLVATCFIHQSQGSPFDALLAFKKGVIAGLLKSHAMKVLTGTTEDGNDNGRLSANANININARLDAESSPESNGNRNHRFSGSLDISGKGHISSDRQSGNTDTTKGSLSGNVQFQSSSVHATTQAPVKVVRVYSVPQMKIPYAHGIPISQAVRIRSNNGMPYGSGNRVNVVVSNSGSGTGAIVNIHQGHPTQSPITSAPTTTTTESIPTFDYDFNETPAFNEVDYTANNDYTTQDSFADFNSTDDSQFYDTNTVNDYDYFSDNSTNNFTTDDYFSSDVGTGDSFSASGAGDFSATGDLPFVGEFETSGSADFSASGATDTGFEATGSADFSFNSDGSSGTTNNGNLEDEYVVTDVTGNVYEVDDTGFSISPSSSDSRSDLYHRFMTTNVAALRKISEIARQHYGDRPLTIRLRTRQSSRQPSTYRGHGTIHHSPGSAHSSATVLKVEKAPLLLKYSDVIESPHAQDGHSSFSVTQAPLNFKYSDVIEPTSTPSAVGVDVSSNDYVFPDFSSTTEAAYDYDYSADTAISNNDTTDFSNDYDYFASSDSNITDYNTDYDSTLATTVGDYDSALTPGDNFNFDSAGQFSASGGNDFNADGSYGLSAMGTNSENDGFNADGAGDFAFNAVNNDENLFSAQGSASFSASSSVPIRTNDGSRRLFNGKAIANRSNNKNRQQSQIRIPFRTNTQSPNLSSQVNRNAQINQGNARLRQPAQRNVKIVPNAQNLRPVSPSQQSGLSFLANFAEAHRQSRLGRAHRGGQSSLQASRTVSSNRGRSSVNTNAQSKSASLQYPKQMAGLNLATGTSSFTSSRRSGLRPGPNNQARSLVSTGRSSSVSAAARNKRNNDSRRTSALIRAKNNRTRQPVVISSLDRKESRNIQRAKLRVRYQDSIPSRQGK